MADASIDSAGGGSSSSAAGPPRKREKEAEQAEHKLEIFHIGRGAEGLPKELMSLPVRDGKLLSLLRDEGRALMANIDEVHSSQRSRNVKWILRKSLFLVPFSLSLSRVCVRVRIFCLSLMPVSVALCVCVYVLRAGGIGGGGKSTAMAQAVTRARSKGWLVLYIPQGVCVAAALLGRVLL